MFVLLFVNKKLLAIVRDLEYTMYSIYHILNGEAMLSYISAKEAAEKWSISQRRVAILCSEERIKGAMMVGNMWIIPANAEKPVDKRTTRKDRDKRKFVVTIEEMISQDYVIYANNISEALEIAEKGYKEGELVLSPGELVCKQISATDGKNHSVEWYEF